MRTLRPRARRWLASCTVTGAAGLAVLGVAATAPASTLPLTAAATSGTATSGTATSGTATSGTATSGTAGVWGPSHVVAGNAALGGDIQPSALTCDGIGDCVAAGNENGPLPGVPQVGSVAEEWHGTWRAAIVIPGLVALASKEFVQVNSVSCGSPGNCVLGGFRVPSSADDFVHIAFIATEKNGTWGKAEAVPGLEARDLGLVSEVTAVSCKAAGDCTGGGFYTVGGKLTGTPQEQDAFVIDEKNGTWGTAKPVPGITNSPGSVAQILSVSCAAPGNCAVGGTTYNNESTTYDDRAFVAQEKNGTWSAPRRFSNISSVTLLSCPSAGDCAAAGLGPGFCNTACAAAYVTEKNGTWGIPHAVGSASIDALSCGSAGNCVAVGSTGVYDPQSAHNQQTLLIQEKKGTWSAPGRVPGIAALNTGGGAVVTTVSCPAAGDCDAGGYYTPSKGKPVGFLVTETSGTWSRARIVIFGGVGIISCFSSTSCAGLATALTAPAFAFSIPDYAATMEKEPVQATRTALSLSASRVTYEREQNVRITAAVSAGLGTPGGAVVVDSGTTVVCVIGLVAGKGTCTLTRKSLRPGTYQLVAYYRGTVAFTRSTSTKHKLTVVR